jgi:hypothetical protein
MKIAVVMVVGLLALVLSGWGVDNANAAPSSKPNILFVIMDDIGIDQMQIFGYGGRTPPSTPNIAQIAGAGIRFRNTWSMPACSTAERYFSMPAFRSAPTSWVRWAPPTWPTRWSRPTK